MSKTNPKEAGLALARRQFLQLGAAGLVTTTALPQAIAAPSKVKSSAKIVIAGAGAAGLSLASRLAQQLDGVQITADSNLKCNTCNQVRFTDVITSFVLVLSATSA